MKHLLEFGLGGLYRFTQASGELTSKLAQGADVEEREVPFLRQVAGEVTDYADINTFYNRHLELQQLNNEWKSLRGSERFKFRREHGRKIKLAGYADNVRKLLAKKRQARKKVEQSRFYSDAVKVRKVDKIEASMDRLVDRFNRKYNLYSQQ